LKDIAHTDVRVEVSKEKDVLGGGRAATTARMALDKMFQGLYFLRADFPRVLCKFFIVSALCH
jgi:hypothetical protein